MNNEELKSIVSKLSSHDDVVSLFMTVISALEEVKSAVSKDLIEIEDKLDKKVQESITPVSKLATSALEIAKETSKLEGPSGYTPTKGIDYVDGQDYVLTEQDIKEIADSITVPVVEKVIEKTTIVKEVPKSGLIIGGSRPVKIFSNGIEVSSGMTELNFTNATITSAGVSKRRVNITTSGGSGFQRPLTGSVNGTNKTFTWTTAPNVIVTDEGRIFQKLQSDGITVNWTGTTTTVLTIAPNFDIFSSA